MLAELANRNPLSDCISSVPNFRPLRSTTTATVDSACHKPEPTCLFRSSRPDRIEERDLLLFKALGIKSIIDFRSPYEYFSADGCHLLDEQYHLVVAKFPRGRNYRHNEPVELKSIATPTIKDGCSVDGGSELRHYLINFFTPHYVWKVFQTVPWYTQLYSLLCLLYDTVFGTGYTHFYRVFASATLNPAGLIGQYKFIIDFSQRSICAALKLLCDRDNLPALMNCAHGKDRTGIVSALILKCLGDSTSYIADEYALSNEGLACIKARIFREMVERYHVSEDFTTASADTMEKLFEYINSSYGSVEDYLVHIGFGFEEQEMLRQNIRKTNTILQVSDSLKSLDVLLESSTDTH